VEAEPAAASPEGSVPRRRRSRAEREKRDSDRLQYVVLAGVFAGLAAWRLAAGDVWFGAPLLVCTGICVVGAVRRWPSPAGRRGKRGRGPAAWGESIALLACAAWLAFWGAMNVADGDVGKAAPRLGVAAALLVAAWLRR
jgi:hypothetical protein